MHTKSITKSKRTETTRLATPAFLRTDQNLWEKFSIDVETQIFNQIKRGDKLADIHRFAANMRSEIALKLGHDTPKDELVFGKVRDSKTSYKVRMDIYDAKYFANSKVPNLQALIKLKAIVLSQKDSGKLQVETKNDKGVKHMEYCSRPSDILEIGMQDPYDDNSYADLTLTMKLSEDQSNPQIHVEHGYMTPIVALYAFEKLESAYQAIKDEKDTEAALKKIGLLAYDLSRLMIYNRGGAAIHGWVLRSLIKYKLGAQPDLINIYGLPFDIYAQVQLDRDRYAEEFAKSVKLSLESKNINAKHEQLIKNTNEQEFPDFVQFETDQGGLELNNEKSMPLSTTIKLPTPSDQANAKPPYMGFFEKNAIMKNIFSTNESSLCLLRGDTRSPKQIKACGGFNPSETLDIYQLLESIDQCEDQTELDRMHAVIKEMIDANLISERQVVLMQQKIELKKMMDLTDDPKLKEACSNEINVLDKQILLIMTKPLNTKTENLNPKSEVEDEPSSPSTEDMGPLDILKHQEGTKSTPTGFVSFTDSIKAATNFSTQESSEKTVNTPIGFVYVVRARGAVYAVDQKIHQEKGEYSLPGGLDWRDIIGFRQVYFDHKKKQNYYGGNIFIQKAFSEKFPNEIKNIGQFLLNPGDEIVMEFKDKVKKFFRNLF